jgi:hypothetical protein
MHCENPTPTLDAFGLAEEPHAATATAQLKAVTAIETQRPRPPAVVLGVVARISRARG